MGVTIEAFSKVPMHNAKLHISHYICIYLSNVTRRRASCVTTRELADFPGLATPRSIFLFGTMIDYVQGRNVAVQIANINPFQISAASFRYFNKNEHSQYSYLPTAYLE